jgi:hypothetical protein
MKRTILLLGVLLAVFAAGCGSDRDRGRNREAAQRDMPRLGTKPTTPAPAQEKKAP